MILWNTSLDILETKFGGIVFRFAPDEKKKISDVMDVQGNTSPSSVVASHLLYKIGDKGLVKLPEDATDIQIKEAKIAGLELARKSSIKVLLNYETLNKERAKAGMSPELPDLVVKKAAKLKKTYDEMLNELDANDIELVHEVMRGLSETDKLSKSITEDVKAEVESTYFNTEKDIEVKKKVGRPKKEEIK